MKTLVAAIVAAASVTLAAQNAGGLDPARILRPLGEAWPTFSGDYSGRRYSTLTQVTRDNVKHLSLAWTVRLNAGPTGAGAGISPPFGPRAPRTITGGVGTNEFVGGTNVKGSILAVDNVLYVTAPDNVWALDAIDGHLLWHYFWRTRGGTHIGNRGAALWRNYLFFVTPDDYLVSLDARTGAERWSKEIANFNQQYFLTSAPTVVDNHVIVGTGNDLDSPGYLMSFDPETGTEQWRWYAVPMNPGDPGLDTWKNLDAARNGGGHPWMPGSYDPETRYYIVSTGNPTPAYTSAPRGAGDNLHTNSVVAIHVDTGKMAWYYQTNPHDTHDWDSAQTPVLVDGEINGKPRKLVVTAARNGYYFTLDRRTGEHVVTSTFSGTVNWAKGLNGRGQPVRDPAKDHHVGGSLVSSNNGGATNWPAQAFSPQTGLLYVPLAENYAMYYLTELDPRGAMGLGGKDEVGVSGIGSYIAAIDYRTGKTMWRHKFRTATPVGRGGPGLLTTAGGLLFGGDISGNFVAFDAAKGTPLWSTRIGQVSNAPQTYLVDGRQHVLVASGDTLFSFALN
jgi:alcohol dehydrogenase (cytochrome c)